MAKTKAKTNNNKEWLEKHHEDMAHDFLELIENNQAPWQKPWSADELAEYFPRNLTTDKYYNGSNILKLMSMADKRNLGDCRWATYKQLSNAGLEVSKGSKAVKILWASPFKVLSKDENNKPIYDKNGKQKEETRLIMKWANVFNIQDIANYKAEKLKTYVWDTEDRAERLIKSLNVEIKEDNKHSAYANAKYINLPPKEQFKSSEGYYSTVLHELIHWTGHKGRLERETIKNYSKNTETRAKEELVAEIGAFLLSCKLGIAHEPSQDNVSYMASWSKAIKQDHGVFKEACSCAEKASNFLLDLEKENNKKLGITVDKPQDQSHSDGIQDHELKEIEQLVNDMINNNNNNDQNYEHIEYEHIKDFSITKKRPRGCNTLNVKFNDKVVTVEVVKINRKEKTANLMEVIEGKQYDVMNLPKRSIILTLKKPPVKAKAHSQGKAKTQSHNQQLDMF